MLKWTAMRGAMRMSAGKPSPDMAHGGIPLHRDDGEPSPQTSRLARAVGTRAGSPEMRGDVPGPETPASRQRSEDGRGVACMAAEPATEHPKVSAMALGVTDADQRQQSSGGA